MAFRRAGSVLVIPKLYPDDEQAVKYVDRVPNIKNRLLQCGNKRFFR
jgi:hypothetical protein